MAVYDIPGVGPVDLGGFDPASLGIGDIGAAAMPAGTTGQSLSSALEVLDAMKRGRYDKPIADMDVQQLSELSGLSGLQFVTNKGKAASTKANRSGFIPFVEDAEYRIVNERGKNQVAYSGIGQEGLMGVYNTAQNLSATGGKKADWYVEAKDPSTGTWVKVADDDPPTDVVGSALDIIGDAALGFVVAGPIGAAVGAGLSAAGVNVTDIAVPIILAGSGLGPIAGAGLGSAAASLAQGRSLEESLIRGLTAAATAGLVEGIPGVKTAIKNFASDIGLDKAIASGLIDDISNAVSNVVSSTAASTAAEIVVTASNAVSNAVSSVLSTPVAAGIGSGALNFVNELANDAVNQISQQYGQQQLEQQFDQAFPQGGTQAGIGGQAPITVYATNPRVDAAVKSMIANAGGYIGDAVFRDLTSEEFNEAKRIYDEQVPPGTTVTAPPRIGGAPVAAGAATGLTDIVVKGAKTPDDRPGGDATAGAAQGLITDATQTPPKDDGKGMGAKDWVRLGLLGLSAIGGAAAGGGGATPRDTTPLTYTPISRTPTISQGIGQPPFDVFTYGQGIPGAQQSEFSFFEPFSWKQPGGTAPVNVATGLPQSQVDAQAAAAQAQAQAAYDANAAKFNAYQDDLAAKVQAGTLTPEQATAEATTYAGTLGLPLAPVPTTTGTPMKEGGEVDDEIMDHLLAYKRMGGHQGPGPVKGIGSGQDDKIPAWLSDGEYVWSAQDVADLGDGSTDEGVRRLDKMRQMVRRRAGRKDVKKIAKPQRGIDTMLKAVGGVA